MSYQNQNQNRSIHKVQNLRKKEGKYPRLRLLTAIFLKQDMQRNFLPIFIKICMETPC